MKCKLFSQRKHPIELSYNGNVMMLPPRGKLTVLDRRLLGAVPKGVIVIEIKNK